ncbi:hypothetical protein C8R46DRAFT_970651 [Mycena filopes]|nr:hypothetical protein C8R46DRAFT_970651 [Mycena filopes]
MGRLTLKTPVTDILWVLQLIFGCMKRFGRMSWVNTCLFRRVALGHVVYSHDSKITAILWLTRSIGIGAIRKCVRKVYFLFPPLIDTRLPIRPQAKYVQSFLVCTVHLSAH